jgi:hypothetical protein
MPSWFSMEFKRCPADIGTTSGLPSFMFLTCKQGYYVTDSKGTMGQISFHAFFCSFELPRFIHSWLFHNKVYIVCSFFGLSVYLVHFLLVDIAVDRSAI